MVRRTRSSPSRSKRSTRTAARFVLGYPDLASGRQGGFRAAQQCDGEGNAQVDLLGLVGAEPFDARSACLRKPREGFVRYVVRGRH